MEDFTVNIDNVIYEIKFEDQKTIFKPLNLSITRIYNNVATILDRKKYNKIRRRIYNNIVNVSKLKDGKIRKYQVFNELELKALVQYLDSNNILFRILDGKRLYDIHDKLHTQCFSKNPQKIYIQVYKGYFHLTKHKIIIPCPEHKYGIYFYKNIEQIP
jgi:hypothetical protein